jgi:hypothetical protein
MHFRDDEERRGSKRNGFAANVFGLLAISYPLLLGWNKRRTIRHSGSIEN